MYVYKKLYEKMDGRTMRWLSNKTGISAQNLSAKFYGKVKWTPKDMESISAVLGIPKEKYYFYFFNDLYN